MMFSIVVARTPLKVWFVKLTTPSPEALESFGPESFGYRIHEAALVNVVPEGIGRVFSPNKNWLFGFNSPSTTELFVWHAPGPPLNGFVPLPSVKNDPKCGESMAIIFRTSPAYELDAAIPS